VTLGAPPLAAPVRWLGGSSPFGLVLPDASPTPSTMYAPRGAWLGDGALIVADTGNHRLLVWPDGVPDDDHADAAVAVGQPDLYTEGPGLLFLPTGVLVHEGRLVVADAWHHRILVWDRIPDRHGVLPDLVLGQDGLDGVDEGCGPQRFYWPFGVAMIGGGLWVADTGNRRVLAWLDGIPEPGRPADVVLGQPSFTDRGENRDGPVAANSLRWPHAVAATGDTVWVADAGNHRVLGWRGAVTGERAADVILGQDAFTTAIEVPYRPQGPSALRFPYGLATSTDGTLAVADTSNNRVLLWRGADATTAAIPIGAPADAVLGQPDLDANGENRWSSVAPDSLCWPYGLAWHGEHLVVVDSGNNRVMVWMVVP
jgi:hypothetical protein